ncbi:hypothetical protein ACOMCU_08405 [Lysinibacillus sp. UGB7]|uniref:hypothetical protein n=1 Tax=Lysinibacillus sp. UGB7 TaxID=3411039 RepID=UPI003B81EB14
MMGMSFTVESVSRVLNKLNIGVSTHSVKRLLDNGKLKRVQRPHYCQNTTYNYLVDVVSLEAYLVNEVGLDANEVAIAIYGGIK